jgi:hypothetical protein
MLFVPSNSLIVRRYRDHKLLRMFESQRQMSIHQGNKPEDVLNQVSPFVLSREPYLISNRQVQDLERQLQEARHKVNQLQSMVNGPVIEDDPEPTSHPRPPKRQKLGDTQDPIIKKNMYTFGHEIFQTPYHSEPATFSREVVNPELPHQEVARALLADYKASTHYTFPFVDIEAISNNLDVYYRDWSPSKASNRSFAVLLGVLACGSLCRRPEDGERIFKVLISNFDFFTAESTIELVQALTLASFYLVETNKKLTGHRLIGCAVRAAQELGLHRWTSQSHQMDERSIAWWTLFCRER